MDSASLSGIILGAVMFVFGVFSNGGFEALKNMVDPASIIITEVLAPVYWQHTSYRISLTD